MSKQETILRQRAIVNKLTQNPSTFQEILDYLKVQGDYARCDLLCSVRTFQRDVKSISTLYDIAIEYDKSQKVYHIIDDAREVHSERLMETFDLYNAIKVGNSYGQSLIFEDRKALGTENLHGLLHAIKNCFEVSFTYHKFYDDTVSQRNIQPAAIKEARNRWYLLGRDTKDGLYKSFGLDRMDNLEISRRSFEKLTDFDPEEEYRYSFGIINGTGEKPEKVELAFTPREGRYIKSLPLHHSQELIKETKEETVFSYYIIPTYDFRQEILSYGDQVKVLKPASLKKDIAATLEAAVKSYK